MTDINCNVKDCRYLSNKGFCMVKRLLIIQSDKKCLNYEKIEKLQEVLKNE
jgi:hypothetical protein